MLLYVCVAQLAGKGTVDTLMEELEHVEPAARIVWKDEEGELASLGAALKQVETQVKLDKNEKFVREFGDFHKQARTPPLTVSPLLRRSDRVSSPSADRDFRKQAKAEWEAIQATKKAGAPRRLGDAILNRPCRLELNRVSRLPSLTVPPLSDRASPL